MKKVFLLSFFCLSLAFGAYAQNGADIAALTKKAEGGDIAAQKKLADIYENGLGGASKDWETSFKWRVAAANAGDRDSMFAVAQSYERAANTEAYKKAAITWYQKIAKADFSPKDTQTALERVQSLSNPAATRAAPLTAEKKDDVDKIIGIAGKAAKTSAADDRKKRANALYKKAESLISLKEGVTSTDSAGEAISLYEQAAALGHPRAADKAKALRAYLYD